MTPNTRKTIEEIFEKNKLPLEYFDLSNVLLNRLTNEELENLPDEIQAHIDTEKGHQRHRFNAAACAAEIRDFVEKKIFKGLK